MLTTYNTSKSFGYFTWIINVLHKIVAFYQYVLAMILIVKDIYNNVQNGLNSSKIVEICLSNSKWLKVQDGQHFLKQL